MITVEERLIGEIRNVEAKLVSLEDRMAIETCEWNQKSQGAAHLYLCGRLDGFVTALRIVEEA